MLSLIGRMRVVAVGSVTGSRAHQRSAIGTGLNACPPAHVHTTLQTVLGSRHGLGTDDRDDSDDGRRARRHLGDGPWRCEANRHGGWNGWRGDLKALPALRTGRFLAGRVLGSFQGSRAGRTPEGGSLVQGPLDRPHPGRRAHQRRCRGSDRLRFQGWRRHRPALEQPSTVLAPDDLAKGALGDATVLSTEGTGDIHEHGPPQADEG